MATIKEQFEIHTSDIEEKVEWYVQLVLAGTITIEEVPTEYRTQVEAMMPVSEEEQWANEIMEEVSEYGY